MRSKFGSALFISILAFSFTLSAQIVINRGSTTAGSGGCVNCAPDNLTYWVRTASAFLSAEVVVSQDDNGVSFINAISSTGNLNIQSAGGKSIYLSSDGDNGSIDLKNDGTIELNTTEEISINSDNDISFDASNDINFTAANQFVINIGTHFWTFYSTGRFELFIEPTLTAGSLKAIELVLDVTGTVEELYGNHISLTGGRGNITDGIIIGATYTVTNETAIERIIGSNSILNIAQNLHIGTGFDVSINVSSAAAINDEVLGFVSNITFSNTSTSAQAFGFYSQLAINNTPTITEFYHNWANDLRQFSARVTNGYYLWYDGGPGTDCNGAGVYRVNDFGISALYNPCFAKYTAGAANFERLVIRWGDTGVFGTDNRGYIGVEEGGTGSDRALSLIGGNLSFVSTLSPAVSDTSANSCGTGTETIVGNDNAGKVTVIGSAGTSCTVTFATAFLNAPSCSVTNETTANLTRATSTTTTVILAGTFLQNDVVAYLCLGR